MPPRDVSVTVRTTEAIDTLNGNVDHFLTALVTEMRDRFRDNVHVVTGAMKASGSVVTPDGSDYAENVAAAAELNPAATFAPEADVGPHEAIVQVPVGYAGFEELGTVHQPAHPALLPAIESTLADADQIARRIFGLDGAGA